MRSDTALTPSSAPWWKVPTHRNVLPGRQCAPGCRQSRFWTARGARNTSVCECLGTGHLGAWRIAPRRSQWCPLYSLDLITNYSSTFLCHPWASANSRPGRVSSARQQSSATATRQRASTTATGPTTAGTGASASVGGAIFTHASSLAAREKLRLVPFLR